VGGPARLGPKARDETVGPAPRRIDSQAHHRSAWLPDRFGRCRFRHRPRQGLGTAWVGGRSRPLSHESKLPGRRERHPLILQRALTPAFRDLYFNREPLRSTGPGIYSLVETGQPHRVGGPPFTARLRVNAALHSTDHQGLRLAWLLA
jgi:hypothetical protein